MTEKRARDVGVGEHVRLIGDLSDEFGQVVNVQHRGDDVLIDVQWPDEVRPTSLPVLDGDEVVEVTE